MAVVICVFDTLYVNIVVDTTKVVTVEEEGALGSGGTEGVADIVEPRMGAVIKSQSYRVGNGAFSIHLSRRTLLRGSTDTAKEGKSSRDEERSKHLDEGGIVKRGRVGYIGVVSLNIAF